MPKRILIIDDDDEFCEELKEILQDEGHSVDCAHDSAHAEKCLKENSYDVALIDFKMPGLNGVETLKKIKSTHPSMKAFIISGRPFIEKLVEEEDLGGLVDGVMNKPMDIEALLETIKKLA